MCSFLWEIVRLCFAPTHAHSSRRSHAQVECGASAVSANNSQVTTVSASEACNLREMLDLPTVCDGIGQPFWWLNVSRIDIHLDLLRIFNYPGTGTHNIMVTFAAQNQVPNASEAVTFCQTYRVPEGETAPIKGWPIFIGLNVGSRGVAVQCSTINVKNEGDETVLKALESPAFKMGLNLLQTAQPAIAPFTDMTLGVVKALAERTQNIPVQKFDLGLDFNETAPMGLRLREGNYIAVQVPEQTTIQWDGRWIYDPKFGTIVHKADGSPLEYNYLVFRVSRYTD